MPVSRTNRTTPDLAIIIVNWNVRDLLLESLRSLFADLETSGLHARVLVVDSASDDGSAQAVRTDYPQVELFAERENVGFVRGNNLALRALGLDRPDAGLNGPRAVYLLNPDTITQPGATRALFDALFSEPRVGLVGANLTYGDGRFQHGAFAFPGLRQLWAEFFPTPGRLIEGRFNGRYPRSYYESDRPFPVDFVLGAAMMLRSEAVRDVGLLDDGFVMYCEEVDWAWRLRRAGWEARCVPNAHVVHLGGQSSGQIRPQTLIHLWTSRLRLFDLYYPRLKHWLARRMVRTGMARLARRAKAASEPVEVVTAYEQIGRMA
ncbi:MAG: glycosyltransferase family 2 protein [Anaerolineae bacterium]